MNNKSRSETNSATSQGKTNSGFLTFLQAAALIALIAGAVGSLVFMFHAGEHTPRLLLVLFTIWVLSPFVVLLWAIIMSKRWSALTRTILYCVTFIVPLSSLAIYSEWIDVRPAGSANAFLFVVVPPVSLIFIAILVPAAALISGRLSRSDDGT